MAGFPASGLTDMTRAPCWLRVAPTPRSRLLDGTSGGPPDLRRVLGDGAIAGELSRAGDVQDGLVRPAALVRVELDQPTVGLEVGSEVGQMHVVVAVGEERVAQGLGDAGLVRAEMVGEDQVQGRPRLRLVVVVPVRVVPGAAPRDLVGGQAE